MAQRGGACITNLEDVIKQQAGRLRYIANSVDLSEPGAEHELHRVARRLEDAVGGTE